MQSPAIYLAQNGGVPENGNFSLFRTQHQLRYNALCDDFGPMNARSIIRFVALLEKEIRNYQGKAQSIVFCAEDGARSLTNASFLLGCFMILKLGLKPNEVWDTFEQIDSELLEVYRDAAPGPSTFGLTLLDCWQGFERGCKKGWIALPSNGSPSLWGMIDVEEYEHYDNPLNADLHEIVPEQIVVFRGPKNLDGQHYSNNHTPDDGVYRDFSPEYYIDILKELGVTTIVQLNMPRYDPAVFTCNGFRHIILLSDAACHAKLPSSLISRFCKIVDESHGLVAVHGRSSFGRAGTLVALHLMRKQGFSAREAMAWVRIMRPGCILGMQQHFLCSIESTISRVLSRSADTAAAAAAAGGRPLAADDLSAVVLTRAKSAAAGAPARPRSCKPAAVASVGADPAVARAAFRALYRAPSVTSTANVFSEPSRRLHVQEPASATEFAHRARNAVA